MTDEEKKVEDARIAEEARVAKEAEDAKKTTEGADFYKTKFEETQEELKKAQFTLNQKRLEEKEKKEKEEPEAPALSAEEIAQKVRADIKAEDDAKFQKSLSTRITDADELAEVEYHLEHTVKPSGDNEKDLAIAVKLAGAKKVEAIGSEVDIAGKAKPITDVVPGTPPKDGETELNAKEQSFSDAIDSHK